MENTRIENEKKDSALRRFGRDLTELAAKGALPPLIGRRKEMLKITQILLQSRKNNLILVGEPGVGKTGIVEGFAQLLVDGKLPDALGRPAVRRVDTLVHRANGWRKKSGLCHRSFAFHWHVGETTTLVEAGSASGSMDAANILKPALARGAIRVIGATTIREYRQTIEKDGALERRFQAVRIEEPSADEAVAILLALRPRLEAHHGVSLEEAALRAAVEWSVRYLPDFRLPDKALDLFLQIFDEGTLTDAQGRKCDFRESVIILTSNLGSGVAKKRRMGFGAEEDEQVGETPTLLEAVKRHFRPELVNRLTKVVHFKPLGLETAREILGKLIRELNGRLEYVAVPLQKEDSGGETPPQRSAARRDSHVRVELDESAEELILREGFSEEYGARNLERVMDRMLGTLIAEALLAGKITAGQTIRVKVEGVSLRLHAGETS